MLTSTNVNWILISAMKTQVAITPMVAIPVCVKRDISVMALDAQISTNVPQEITIVMSTEPNVPI